MRLLGDYRGYLMTDDYAGYNALALQPGVEHLPCMAPVPCKLVNSIQIPVSSLAEPKER